MNTVNIELSDRYEGGGLFYIKPLASTGEIPEEYGGNDWIDSVKRENTSDILFPDLRAGNAIFYNYTVEHGVAPIESGTRYSMAFFFDIDNPGVRDDFDSDDSKDEDENEFEVEIQNNIPDVELDIVLVYDVITRISTWKRIFDKVLPDERAIYFAYEGDLLRAFVAGTETVVSDIEIKRDQYMYTISQIEPSIQSIQIGLGL